MSASRIQFDDDIHPVHLQSGGVRRLRSREVTGVGSIRASSLVGAVKREAEHDAESMTNIEDRDFKTKQVWTSSIPMFHMLLTITTVVYRLAIAVAGISVHRGGVRRHRHEPAIRVLFHLHRRSQPRRPPGRALLDHLESDHHGHFQILLDHPPGRR